MVEKIEERVTWVVARKITLRCRAFPRARLSVPLRYPWENVPLLSMLLVRWLRTKGRLVFSIGKAFTTGKYTRLSESLSPNGIYLVKVPLSPLRPCATSQVHTYILPTPYFAVGRYKEPRKLWSHQRQKAEGQSGSAVPSKKLLRDHLHLRRRQFIRGLSRRSIIW